MEIGRKVQLIASQFDDVIRFEVHDTGIGLKEENTALVFQRFYRVDKSRSRTPDGSGIGLTITKNIVDAHGDVIYAKSAGLGFGTPIYVRVPFHNLLPVFGIFSIWVLS